MAASGNVDAMVGHLRDAGYRITAARRAVLRSLDQVGPHFTADDVFAAARTIHPDLGRATVYRTLELGSELGLVRPLALGTGELSYLLGGDGHHHLVCVQCHACFEFEDCALGELGGKLAGRFGFEVHGHLLELYGLCARCRAA